MSDAWGNRVLYVSGALLGLLQQRGGETIKEVLTMLYAERAYAGPDITGARFPAEPVAHCAAWRDHARLMAMDIRGRSPQRPRNDRGVVAHGMLASRERVQR